MVCNTFNNIVIMGISHTIASIRIIIKVSCQEESSKDSGIVLAFACLIVYDLGVVMEGR